MSPARLRSALKKIIFFLGLLSLPLFAGAQAEKGEGAGPRLESAQPTAEFPLRLLNRTVTVFRTSLLGLGPKERVFRTQRNIESLLDKQGPGEISIRDIPQGQMVLLDGVQALLLTAGDEDAVGGETLLDAAQRSARALRQVVVEHREVRSVEALLSGVGYSALATLALALGWWLLGRVRTWLTLRLASLASVHGEKLKVGNAHLLSREGILAGVRALVRGIHALLAFLLIYEWLGFVLARFPYTRPWGERLSDYLLSVLTDVFSAVLGALPNLLVSLLIFAIAYLVAGGVRSFFNRVAAGQIKLTWLEAEMAPPTRRLVVGGVWIFALAMAYPYLPGAQTDAFKGLSVLVGLMISLGSSSIVAQAGSGLILMYSRALKPGEYVRIAEQEGTVVELGMFATRIRTGLGEELTLPNSLVLGNVTKNYSRALQGPGFVVDTVVTIGYDTPWRQVEAMLVEAARRTPGVLTAPPPKVFQTALSDFYPEYRLVCQAMPSEPRPRAEVLNALHGNIQDVFNEYGVQIMSPNYFEDPAEPKLVPREKWHLPPAKPE